MIKSDFYKKKYSKVLINDGLNFLKYTEAKLGQIKQYFWVDKKTPRILICIMYMSNSTGN